MTTSKPSAGELADREIQVVRLHDGFIARRINASGWSEKNISDQIAGMLINADTDNWIVRDTEWGKS
jgi:hypothetical protein